jgi:hypothetical protein
MSLKGFSEFIYNPCARCVEWDCVVSCRTLVSVLFRAIFHKLESFGAAGVHKIIETEVAKHNFAVCDAYVIHDDSDAKGFIVTKVA